MHVVKVTGLTPRERCYPILRYLIIQWQSLSCTLGSERQSRLIEESKLPDFLTRVPHHIVTIAVLYTSSDRKSRLSEESELPDFLTQVPHHTVTVAVLYSGIRAQLHPHRGVWGFELSDFLRQLPVHPSCNGNFCTELHTIYAYLGSVLCVQVLPVGLELLCNFHWLCVTPFTKNSEYYRTCGVVYLNWFIWISVYNRAPAILFFCFNTFCRYI